ncbi:uncharacterized protein LOC124360360 isoform X3 [Homalodisca vitripennis]|uniref:uncharacterized protein LOC124360360 isoform X3 n=1 Tax=Homalodisca vitripennis TaxID=197043 RepID=UPI001EEC3256|nr:uncharacterized protein LOC124360360 isoform X3 [Homalodisca vitripennis]
MAVWWCLPSPCYLVTVAGAALVPRTPPTIEELLWTIRDAWPPPPPRSLSLDSEKRDRPKAPTLEMGTGNKLNGQSAPKMGLPYRRYSVPETVMRKYSLSRAQTSASDVVTVPTPSVPSIGTSQDSGGTNTKRMSHKACQTTPPDSFDCTKTSVDNIQLPHGQEVAIPTVNIIPSVDFSTKLENEEVFSKHSSNSNEFSQSEEISDSHGCVSQVYRSEISLPGAVAETSMFLTVPELLLDPHDCPKVNSDEEDFNSATVQFHDTKNICGVESDEKRYLDISEILNDENFKKMLSQQTKEQRKSFLQSKSKSVPESSEPPQRINRSGSAGGETHTDVMVSAEDRNSDDISVEGTPTPALTCHTFDSQRNTSECYITDCDMCTAEGRKCCSLDDSGSQSCSFTSPEMITTNELKSSSDYTTSSMTLDQTVSDRTISTQDSTVSLTSITPESGESKGNINISPILVINSETIIVDTISPRNKTKDREIFHPSESSPSDSSKSDSQPAELHFSDSFPAIISCESAIVSKIQDNNLLKCEKLDGIERNNELLTITETKSVLEEPIYPELNNNEIDVIKESNEEEEPQPTENLEHSSTKDNKETETKGEVVGNYSTNYLYLTEEDSGTNSDQIEAQREVKGNYATNYLYLTEEESGTNPEEIEAHRAIKGNYTTNYLYLTEDESGVNPDSLEISRKESNVTKQSEDDFEMDSLAINESTEEDSNLLENLGFCEDLSKIQYPPNINAVIDAPKNEPSDTNVQEKFYGNTTYELLLKDNVDNKANFMGNVMPAVEDKGTPLKCNNLFDKPFQGSKTKLCSDTPDILDETKPEDNDILDEKDNIRLFSDSETTMGSVAGGTYWELPGKELVIPRFSALPRTLSMIVNTSSLDCSSDSDLSLADSLEDNKSDDKSKGLKLYNKYDNRLVRGDIIALLPEETGCSKKSSKEPQAYFLSLTGEEGKIEVKQIPEELKQKLLKRSKEAKRRSEHSLNSAKKCKGKHCSKKSRKYHNHRCTSTIEFSPNNSYQNTEHSESTDKISKCTQWEDFGSSKDSSDTLVPSDFSERDKDTVYDGEEYKTKETATSPYMCDLLQSHQQNTLTDWLETINNRSTDLEDSKVSNVHRNLNKNSKLCDNQNTTSGMSEASKHVSKGIQCKNMPHIDSALDEEISQILTETLKGDMENQEKEEQCKFKCIEHQVPWSKHIETQVSETDFYGKNICDNYYESMQGTNMDIDNDYPIKSKSVQTVDGTVKQIDLEKEHKNNCSLTYTMQHNESNKIKLNLSGSLNDKCDVFDLNNKCLNDIVENTERCKTPILGERASSKNENMEKQQEKIFVNKPTAKFNLKTTPTRRPGNLSSRFRQKFEVIPEEKSGSMDSSNDERKSPLPTRNRRASMPSEMIMADIGGHNENKSSDSSTSSSIDKQESEECDHIRNVQTSQNEGNDYHRRHTIHGNLTSRHTKMDSSNTSFEKNEQSRRHTIHGSLALNSKNESMIKQLNLLGGTLLKGRVFGKQSGVMFGRFRPINEETQVQKDERSLVEEHLERLRRESSKGREALAVAKTEEQEELVTLSKGWINFYLLRDSQDLGSDGSIDEGSQDLANEDKSRRAPPSMKTVTVVSKPEEELRHQYTVQINASPETGKLPDLSSQHHKNFKTPSVSPELILPDITPTSSPPTSPLLPEIPISIKSELPQIHSKRQDKTKRSTNDKFKSNNKKPAEKPDKKEKIQTGETDLRYLKLSSMKQELQTEKTYYARSGEVACSELSPSSKSSSSSVTADSPTLPSIKWPSRQLQRRSHTRHSRSQSSHPNTQACWTVTLAGSSGHPSQPPPDVEMRLSFSNTTRGQATSQSDSGLGEDGPSDRGKKQQALPPPLAQSNQWKVMLKTQQETDRSSDPPKGDKRTCLPDFSYTPSTARSKKSTKPVFDREEVKRTRTDHFLVTNMSCFLYSC